MLRTLGFDLGFAVPLALLTRGVLGDALAEELLADKGRHSLGVVLNAGNRAVGGAGAFPLEISLTAIVAVGVIFAKGVAGVNLGSTPIRPGGNVNSVGVDGHVEGALVGLNRLGRNSRDGHGEEGKRRMHLE